MNTRKIPVAVVVPAYNEGQVIKEVVKKTIKSFARSPFAVDIVVINDGSGDNTSSQAKQGGAIVIDHILNSGAGAATATGLSYANQNGYLMAVTMDADGQHLASDVLKGVELMQNSESDLLIGSRLIDSNGMSKLKVIGNWGLSTITYLLFGVRSTDSQSGLRVYSRKALESLHWKTSGFEFCSEMIWRAKQIGLSIDEYPIQAVYTEYSKAKGQNNWNGVNILKSLVQRRLTEMFE